MEENRLLQNKLDNDASYYSEDEATGRIVKKRRIMKKLRKRSQAEIDA
jgi:hypothetical protein